MSPLTKTAPSKNAIRLSNTASSNNCRHHLALPRCGDNASRNASGDLEAFASVRAKGDWSELPFEHQPAIREVAPLHHKQFHVCFIGRFATHRHRNQMIAMRALLLNSRWRVSARYRSLSRDSATLTRFPGSSAKQRTPACPTALGRRFRCIYLPVDTPK